MEPSKDEGEISDPPASKEKYYILVHSGTNRLDCTGPEHGIVTSSLSRPESLSRVEGAEIGVSVGLHEREIEEITAEFHCVRALSKN